MKTFLKVLSFTSLALMLCAAILMFSSVISRTAYHAYCLLGTLGWFATVPFWMKRRLHYSD